MVQKCLEIIFTSSQFTYSGTLSGDDVGTTEAQWCPRDESLVCQSLSVSDSSVTLAGRTSLMCLRVLWVTSILGWHKLSVLHSIVFTLQNKELFILRGSCVCVYIYIIFLNVYVAVYLHWKGRLKNRWRRSWWSFFVATDMLWTSDKCVSCLDVVWPAVRAISSPSLS